MVSIIKINDYIFSVDISRPDEIMSNKMDTYIDYNIVAYTVCGTISSMGQHEICISDILPLTVIISNGFVSPNEQTEQYFTISVTKVQLPHKIDGISDV